MKQVFLVYTEYHLMFAVSAIIQHYSDPSFENIIIHPVKSSNQNRASVEIDTESFNATLIRMGGPEYEVHKEDPLRDLIKSFVKDPPQLFVGFLEQTPYNTFLVNRLSGKDCKIVLAQDAAKPYKDITKNTWKSQLYGSFKTYLLLWKKGLYFTKLRRQRDEIYAYSKEIEELWLSHPEKFNNRTKKQLRKIDIFRDKEVVKRLGEVFMFNKNSGLESDEGLIFYLNHPVYNQEIYGFELEMLQSVLNRFPEKKIYIKLHPLTPDSQVDAFKKMDRVVVNASKIPAELFIASLKNSIILSLWSTSLYLENDDCNYYWLYPMVQKNGMLNYMDINMPTNHVHKVDSVDQLTFNAGQTSFE